MIRWTGLAPWEFELPFPGSLTSAFLQVYVGNVEASSSLEMLRYFTEMCSGSEAGSYLRLMDFVYFSTLGLREIKKKKMLRSVLPGRYLGGLGVGI